jgi:hypothetical protein
MLPDGARINVPKERLESWKAIAVDLKRSPRPLQRWHAENGLSVNHFGGSKGPVFAFPAEPDTWLSGFAEVSYRPQSHGVQSGEVHRLKSAELTADAQELWELRGEENLGRIAGLYRQAIEQDPRNAATLLGFSNSMILSALLGVIRSSAAYPRATEALNWALRRF